MLLTLSLDVAVVYNENFVNIGWNWNLYLRSCCASVYVRYKKSKYSGVTSTKYSLFWFIQTLDTMFAWSLNSHVMGKPSLESVVFALISTNLPLTRWIRILNAKLYVTMVCLE